MQGFEPHFLEDFFAGGACRPLTGSVRLLYSENMTAFNPAYANYGTLVVEEWNAASGNR